MTGQIDTKQLFDDLDAVWTEFISRISGNSYNVNEIPFAGSWTIAQLATHVTKSNKAVHQGMHMAGKPAGRDPKATVPHLENTFLNFEKKLQSPDFIVPEERNYIHSDVVQELTESVEKLKEDRVSEDLTYMINMKIFGEITRLELLYFVLFHTQRHLHQLKNIQDILPK